MILLGLLSDLLLLSATIGMAIYCRVLSKRLRAFNDLETGIGGTVAALSLQVDQLQSSLQAARSDVDDRTDRMTEGVAAADDRIGRLEMLMAGLEDLEAELQEPLHATTQEDADAAPAFRAFRHQA
ncbi:hypothetical protein [Jannaschia sp. M317]|uniref:hypothetical protein n=1 Tax=Jannaschia sp. M317 TaxID=2867011 RepID=UPI0021A41D00|nr:hypothetical protein [Jannaschia sp. M317]UWQ18441.1 hypothetical protein K3551_03820 [Jannaschia sp. M317]